MWQQACALVEPSGPWCQTFTLRWLENLSFFSYKYTRCHGFHSFRALGSLQFSLQHSLGINEIKSKLNSRQCWSAVSGMWLLEMHLLLHRGFWVFTAFSLRPGHCAGIVWLLALFQISYLFNSHGWPPILFFIQKRQTYCSWWIYIRVKDWRFKFTWKSKRYTVLLSFHFLIISHWNSLLYHVTIKCLIRSLHFCRVWARASFSYFHNNFFSVHVQFGCAGRI